MVTFKSVSDKFEDKSLCNSLMYVKLMCSLPPVFDPASWELVVKGREELFEDWRKLNEPHFKYHKQVLEEANVWIDHQNYN